jgi:hypothetical protein
MNMDEIGRGRKPSIFFAGHKHPLFVERRKGEHARHDAFTFVRRVSIGG